MVRFKKLKWKNFQAAGNVWIEVDLDNVPLTMIIGKNGAGKSTLLDAFCFVNFGRAYRKFNKTDVINTINKKECRVIENFEISGDDYEVERGLAPTFFEIRKNGTRLEITGETPNQTELQSILGCNYKTFVWMAILGKANYKPFMELEAKERREFIEDVLDIQVFTAMNKMAKDKAKVFENSVILLDIEIKSLQAKLAALQKAQKEATSNFQEQIDKSVAEIERIKPQIEQYEKEIAKKSAPLTLEADIRLKIKGYNDLKIKLNSNIQMLAIQGQIDTATTEIENLNSQIEQYDKEIVEKSLPLTQEGNIRSKITEYTELKAKIGAKLQAQATQTIFLENNDNCPTCRQEISRMFKDEATAYGGLRIVEYKKALEELNVRLAKQEEKYYALDVVKNEVNRIKHQLAVAKGSKSTHELNVSQLKKKITKDIVNVTEKQVLQSLVEVNENIDSEEKRCCDFDNIKNEVNRIKQQLSVAKGSKNIYELNIEQLRKKMSTTTEVDKDITETSESIDIRNQERETQVKSLRRYQKTVLLLKDDAIKGQIIKESLPLINQTVNDFLKQMDFFVQIEFDEEFNETIKSRYRDSFKWNHFSEGEKMRINLAILLTWRHLAAMNARMDTNILMMDEILNGSLEEEGIDDFMAIIERSYSDRNIFIISHSADMMADKFHNILKFEKKGEFSQMVTT